MRSLLQILTLTTVVLTAQMTGMAAAQGLFSPVITVDDKVITQYEINQRVALLKVLRTQGNLNTLAREQLVEDRLKLIAADRAGFSLTAEGVEKGMEEFAGRANLELDEFLQVLTANGVEREALADFVRSGLTWREIIRGRFNARATVSDAEVDRAFAATGSSGGVRVLLTEIILPARPIRGEQATAARQATRLQNIRSTSAFSAEARRLSVSQSRNNGGRLDWMPLSNLPAPLRPLILGLKVGEVTAPIEVPNALVLFQLRALEETTAATPEVAAIDYAALYLPGGGTEAGAREARRIRDRIDTCDDLYGVARKMPPEQLERGALSPSEIPQDIALELAKLDTGEVSTALTRAGGETIVLLMLCSRTAAIAEDASREGIREQLRSRRLESFAAGYLAELRADALIITK